MGKKSKKGKKAAQFGWLSRVPSPSRIPHTGEPVIDVGEYAADKIAGLLEHLKFHWLLGEFQPLEQLELDEIDAHPDRAMLALFAALGKANQGLREEAGHALQKAIDWGCSKSLAARVLLADAHRSLGVCYSQSGSQNELQLQKEKINKLLGHAFPADRLLALPSAAGPDDSSAESDVPSPSRRRRIVSAEFDKVIVVAGMRHSGSTALFNIFRLAFEQLAIPFIGCYSEKEDCCEKVLNSSVAGLVKVHEFRGDVLQMADVVITTRRDLRDTVASAVRRKFTVLEHMTGNKRVEYAKFNRSLHAMWLPHSHYEFVYERFMREPGVIVSEVLGVVGISEGVNISDIVSGVTELPVDQYETILLSPTHITDPGHTLKFSDTLPPDTEAAISLHHFDWLQKYGYDD